jgi:hypothetical protein
MIHSWRYALAPLLVCGAVCAGCRARHPAGPIAVGYMGRTVTLAVVPVQDLSGTATLDPLAMTDIFAQELAQVPRVSVVPVSQTVAVMLGQGWRALRSPDQAQMLAGLLNADGVAVVAVTMYDPYDPPRLGLIAEVYLLPTRPTAACQGEDVGRSPAPLCSRPAARFGAPDRQVQRVFDAGQQAEQRAIRQFARRDAHGEREWREYLRDQRQFLRYCSWQTVIELVSGVRPACNDDAD